MFGKLLAYYLPVDATPAFRLPWVWERARQYAYRNAIAGVALTGIFLGAEAHALPGAALAAQVLTIVNVFFATVFTAAALDPRFR
ncbi:MAG: hypothetical protein M0R77_10735 [Gammaproteobacteria bacterium]|nr:hypothetical protein [Gammaproteobacteria bacterium]